MFPVNMVRSVFVSLLALAVFRVLILAPGLRYLMIYSATVNIDVQSCANLITYPVVTPHNRPAFTLRKSCH